MKILNVYKKAGAVLSLLRLTVFMLVAAFSCPAFAATLAGWDMSGATGYGASPMTATTSALNLTVGGLTRGSGVVTTGTAAGRGWGGLAWTGANVSAAVTANLVASFTVTPNSGNKVSFSSVNRFDYRRSSTGPANGVLQYQIGTGSFTDIAVLSYTVTASTGGSLAAVDLSTISALQNIPAGTTVTFRIVNYGGGSGGSWYIFDKSNTTANDFEILGTVEPDTTIQNYTLTTNTTGNGSGIISGIANPYVSGSTATITATPGTSSAFSGWSGCSTSTNQTISVLMDNSKSCTANFTATGPSFSIFHVNDTHARMTPHKMIIPGHGTSNSSEFEDVGGAAHLAGKMLQLTAEKPNSLVIDAGDISEGNPIGDMNGNGSMTQFYTLLSGKLLAQRGRGMDAVVVGNHDVRDLSYVNNLMTLKNSGVPVLSVNVRDKNTHLPYFAPYNIVTINGKKIGIIGYTVATAEIGPTLTDVIEIVPCAWSGSATCNISDYVNDLRNNKGVDIVVLAAHSGHSALVDPDAPVLLDNGVAKLPEVVVTGHWHTISDTVWQPKVLNYKTIFTEANSYMKYIGELQLTDTGRYFNATNHIIRNADITPDPDVQMLVNRLINQYNTAHPGHSVDEVVGFTSGNLLLDNDMKWWTDDEYPWSGNNTAGQWICDAMRWKSEQLFGQTDLSIETGGGVRADIPAGPVTYLQIYETFPWNDDTFYRVNMTGQEIFNFLKITNLNTGFSSALDVTAFDGIPTSVKFNNAPIELNKIYTVAINNYMYAHPPTGWTWSDKTPLTSAYLCREGIVDFMRSQHPDKDHGYQVGGARYHLNTDFSGGYRAVVTMMNDNDTVSTFEDAFIRFISATPETLARRGTIQVPSDLVNADGSINPGHHLAEQEMYRSFLGFKSGSLKSGDIIETWGKGSFYGGNPEFVDQEGIYADGVEFKIVGHDSSLAKPAYMSSVKDFWNDHYKNHYVQFLAKKTGTDTVSDQSGQIVKLWDATGYVAKAIPGNTGDTVLVSGVPTMENYALRFRCDSVTASGSSLPAVSVVSSHVTPAPASVSTIPLTLTASASSTSGTYYLSPIADAQVASNNPGTNYGSGTNLYVQSSVNSYGNERAWLKFDLSGIPASANISSASLQLWNFKATGATIPVEVNGGSDDTWTETGLTWSNQPAFGTALSTRSLITGTSSVWYNWDVSSFVQNKWSTNKLVSVVVKPVTENSTDTTAPSYAFDAREYGSNAPILQINTQAAATTVTRVDYYYRYSGNNSTWSAWTLYSNSTVAPFTSTFTYPNGQGYYEFYSRATDSNGNVEPAPAAAHTSTHYTAVPPYTTEAIVSLGSLTTIFDGTAKSVSVTTIPPGLNTSTTYNGSNTVPVTPGTYSVSATVSQAGYTGTGNSMMTIAKAVATVNIFNLNQTCNGASKSASTSTFPAGLAVTVTYNGSTEPPVAAGTYTVVATINDSNYQGSASGTLTLTEAPGSVAVPAFELWGIVASVCGLFFMMSGRRKIA